MEQSNEHLDVLIKTSLLCNLGKFFKISGGEFLFDSVEENKTEFDYITALLHKLDLGSDKHLLESIQELLQESANIPEGPQKFLAQIIQKSREIAYVSPKIPRKKIGKTIETIENTSHGDTLHDFYRQHRRSISPEAMAITPSMDGSGDPDTHPIKGNKYIPMHSIFNTMEGKSSARGKVFYNTVDKLWQKTPLRAIEEYRSIDLSKKDFKSIEEEIVSILSNKGFKNNYHNFLLELLEFGMSYIPSDIDHGFSNDISLYEFTKVSTAIASSLYLYSLDNGLENIVPDPETNCFLLLKCKLFGSQGYVNKLNTQSPCETIQARSFFINLLMENLLDEVLETFDCCRTNILSRQFDEFILLLPNLTHVFETCQSIGHTINQWLIEEFGVTLSLTLAYEEINAHDLMNISDQEGGMPLFAKLKSLETKLVSQQKQLYSLENLQSLMIHNPENPKQYYECFACGTYIDTETVNQSENLYVYCHVCQVYKHFKNHNTEFSPLIGISTSLTPNRITFKIPSLRHGSLYCYFLDDNEAGDYNKIYAINYLASGLATNIWLFDHNNLSKDPQEIEPKDLVHLYVKLDEQENWLSHILFKDTFNISKYVSMQTQMSYLKTKVCQDVCKFFLHPPILNIGELSDPTFLNHFKVLYTDVNAMYLTGNMYSIINFVVHLKRHIKKITGTRLTISAAIDIFPSGFPLYQSYLNLHSLLQGSDKTVDNTIALLHNQFKDLFGFSTPFFNWNNFETGICPKVNFLLEHCFLGKNSSQYIDHKGSKKIMLSDIFIGQLKQLLLTPINQGIYSINLARVAHLFNTLEVTCQDDAIVGSFKNKVMRYLSHNDLESIREMVVAIDIFTYICKKDVLYCINNTTEAVR